jgi:hypothetical protein
MVLAVSEYLYNELKLMNQNVIILVIKQFQVMFIILCATDILNYQII